LSNDCQQWPLVAVVFFANNCQSSCCFSAPAAAAISYVNNVRVFDPLASHVQAFSKKLLPLPPFSFAFFISKAP
jgi:hypothetical protein